MIKIDLKKELKYLYAPSSKNVEVVDVPKSNFVMVDGRIEPGEAPDTSREFQEAIEALYGASFTLKFMLKRRDINPIDYTVMALEGLWWTDTGDFDFNKKEKWMWTVMIMQPDHINEEMYRKALQNSKRKRTTLLYQRCVLKVSTRA